MTALKAANEMNLDLNRVRRDFPVLQLESQGKPVVYLDNAATMQKPYAVLDAMNRFYTRSYANVHRSVHWLSHEATEAFEGVRHQVAEALGADSFREVIFTKGATEAINLVVEGWARKNLKSGDTVAVTRMEHHANFVPWLKLCEGLGSQLQVVDLDQDYRLSAQSLQTILKKRPGVLAVTAVSNVLGTKNPLPWIVKEARKYGVKVLVDAAQAVAHGRFSRKELGDPDFIVFSAHKMGGPTGVGVLWAREEILQSMEPYQVGGEMILEVREDRVLWNELPWKFEAGTPPVAEVIGLGAILTYLSELDSDQLDAHEKKLTQKSLSVFSQMKGVELLGPKTEQDRVPIFSFCVEGIHAHDLGTYLDGYSIAVRSGHHCSQPLHAAFGKVASTRASLCFYNTEEELNRLKSALEEAVQFFRKRGLRG